jgi:hypothetical protein
VKAVAEARGMPGAAAFQGTYTPEPAALAERDWVSLGDSFGSLKAVQFVQRHVDSKRLVYKVNTVLGLAERSRPASGLPTCRALLATHGERWRASPPRSPTLLRISTSAPLRALASSSISSRRSWASRETSSRGGGPGRIPVPVQAELALAQRTISPSRDFQTQTGRPHRAVSDVFFLPSPTNRD